MAVQVRVGYVNGLTAQPIAPDSGDPSMSVLTTFPRGRLPDRGLTTFFAAAVIFAQEGKVFAEPTVIIVIRAPRCATTARIRTPSIFTETLARRLGPDFEVLTVPMCCALKLFTPDVNAFLPAELEDIRDATVSMSIV